MNVAPFRERPIIATGNRHKVVYAAICDAVGIDEALAFGKRFFRPLPRNEVIGTVGFCTQVEWYRSKLLTRTALLKQNRVLIGHLQQTP